MPPAIAISTTQRIRRTISAAAFTVAFCFLIEGCGNSISGTTSTTTTTTTTVAAAPASLTADQVTELSATVTNATGAAFVAPSGSITFVGNSGSSLGISPLVTNADQVSASGTLTVSGAALTTGANIVSSSYAGDTFHTSSVSPTIVITVGSTTATVTTASVLTATPAAITTAQNTTLTATIVAASGTAAPTGTVGFIDQSNGITLGTAVLATSITNSTTAAILASGSSMNIGNNSILAEYQGNASFAASNSAPATVAVSNVPSSVDIISARQ